MEINKLYNSDCIDGMKKMEKDSVDLVIADPPYNLTSHDWDKFENNQEYINFLGEFIFQSGRILKQTGSFYIFHSNFEYICRIQELVENNTGLKNKRLIIWNKSFPDCGTEYLKSFYLKRDLNNYPAYCEYILFYGFEKSKYTETIQTNKENFKEYKDAIQEILKKKKLTYNSKVICNTLKEKLGYKTYQSANSISQRLFNRNSRSFGMITKKQFEVLDYIVGFGMCYNELLNLYESGKINPLPAIEKEMIETTFNNQHSHHSIWNYDAPKNPIHPTQKPEELIKNIIIHSSNENDIVLDPFMGSGVVVKECKKLNRNYIGFEKDKEYFDNIDV